MDKKTKLFNNSNFKKVEISTLQSCIGQGSISRIDNLFVKDFFSIQDIELTNLKDKQEIYIVGENGDGKTLLLQSIVISLFGSREGDVLNLVNKLKNTYQCSFTKSNTTIGSNVNIILLAYGASRNNSCRMKEERTGYLSLFSGEYDLKSPMKWLIDLYNAQNAKETTVISLDNAIKLLKYLLNREIEIMVTYKNVSFKEKNSEVSFEQLSAGYRGVITIICDIIARLSEKQQVESISDFQGIVLIDEVELHLHPKWQYSFMNKLRETFPLIQFIVTTHSPTVLLGAGEEALFYKIYKENGETKISQPINSIKNLMANNLSTSPLFDMTTARARNSDDKLKTDEDYIYTKIHEIVSKKVQGKKAIIEDEIVNLINKELDDYIKEQGL